MKYFVVEYWNGGYDMEIVFEGSFDECNEWEEKNNHYSLMNHSEEGMEVMDEDYVNYHVRIGLLER